MTTERALAAHPLARLPVVASYLPFVLACGAIGVVSHLSEPPVPEALVFRFSDKLMHAAAYAVLGALAFVGASRRRLSLSRAAVWEAVLLASAYGALDELHQAFVPKRFASVGDFVADAIGATLGVLVFRALLVRSLSRANGIERAS